MRTKTILAVAFVLALLRPVQSAAALSEEGLLELAEKGVSIELTISIIECDCVDFPVDARAALRLDDKVPAPVLDAVIDCHEKRNSAGAQAIAPAAPPPPAVPAAAPVATAVPVAAAAVASPPAQPPMPSGQAYTLSEVKSVALIPVAMDGKYDKRMTKSLRKELGRKRAAFTLSSSFADSERPLSTEPIQAILQAGRTAGVEAVMLGTGSTFTASGYPVVQLDAKLVEVNRGQVLWAAEGSSPSMNTENAIGGADISWHEARTAATKRVMSQFP